MGYPPYSDLIQMVFSSKEEAQAKGAAEGWFEKIQQALPEAQREYLFRPQAAPMKKIKEIYRYSMMLKCPHGMWQAYTAVLERIKEAVKARKKNYTVTIDINPYSFI